MASPLTLSVADAAFAATVTLEGTVAIAALLVASPITVSLARTGLRVGVRVPVPPNGTTKLAGVSKKPCCVTDTVACAWETPAGPWTVSVYVVVCVGVTVALPLGPTSPTLGSIHADVPPVVAQLRVDGCPSAIVDGLAVKLETLGGATLRSNVNRPE